MKEIGKNYVLAAATVLVKLLFEKLLAAVGAVYCFISTLHRAFLHMSRNHVTFPILVSLSQGLQFSAYSFTERNCWNHDFYTIKISYKKSIWLPLLRL